MGGKLTRFNDKHKQKHLITVLQGAIRGNDIGKLKSLLKEGADVNFHPEQTDPALILAVRYDHIECVRLLIKSGADVNISDHWGETALYRAVSFRHNQCMHLLILAGADVNQASCYGYTPLHQACVVGSCKAVEILTEAGADANLADKTGRTALHKTVMYKDRDECVRQLIRAGADVNLPDSSGNLPLFRSSFNISCARILLFAGARVNARNNLHQDIFQYRSANRDYYDTENADELDDPPANDRLTQLISVFANVQTSKRDVNDDDNNNENTFCLMKLCRKTIRRELIRNRQGFNFLSGFVNLGLPAALVSYLLYERVSSEDIVTLLQENEGPTSSSQKKLEDSYGVTHKL